MTEQTPLRLNKYLALHMGTSRREGDDLIAGGSVTINRNTAQLGARVTPSDKVAINGVPLGAETKHRYIAFHKPTGYVCSRKQQGDAPTIYEILPPEMLSLKPVGRLDKDTSGLILLTNDGDFAHSMTHPSFYKSKVYEVKLDAPLQPFHRQMISDKGVLLEDGSSQFELERMVDDNDTDWRITMHEGRNRQIRRTFVALGYSVTGLHRTIFGNYALDDIPASEYRELDIS